MDPKLPRAIIIACGSFSPITPMHLRMFEIAKDHFEMNNTLRIVGGIISPTHDAYGKEGLVSATHRCSMIKLATRTSDWIRLSDWEVHQDGWSRTKLVLQYHKNFINNYINGSDINHLAEWMPRKLNQSKEEISLKLLCGADLLESFSVPGLWLDEDIEEIVGNHGLIVISRSGANPEKFIFDSDILTKYKKNIYLITNWVPNEISSSMIRRLVYRNQSVKYLIDDFVLDYIKRNDLYKTKTSPSTKQRNGDGDAREIFNDDLSNNNRKAKRKRLTNR